MFSTARNVKQISNQVNHHAFVVLVAWGVLISVFECNLTAEEKLSYPKRIAIPDDVAMHSRITIREMDGTESEVIYSPYISYLYGHYLGWKLCMSDAAENGYTVVEFDLNEVNARCAVKCITPEFGQARIQGYKDCQAALKKMKSTGVAEDQLRKSLLNSEHLQFPSRPNIF